MLAQFTAWLIDVIKAFFTAIWTFVVDAVVNIVDLLLGALVSLLALIPVPSFLSGGLQSLYGLLDPGIAYVVSAAGLPQALSIIGAGYVFRLGRKVATLFQW